MRSRGALASEFCSTKQRKAPDPVPSDACRRWYRLHLDRARTTKNQEGETPTDACSFRPHLRMRPRALTSFSSACTEGGEGRARLSAFHRGACGSEPTPPLSSSTRFLGRSRSTQSRWFERPCAVQRALPAPSIALKRSTPRPGRSAGGVDARAARGRGYKPRPQEPHSLHRSAVAGDVPSIERD